MFGSASDCDTQSGLLRSGKRYKRDLGSNTLGQNNVDTSLSPEDSNPEKTPFVRNPPITPQRRPGSPQNLSPSESNPNPSSSVVGQSPSVSSPPPITSPPPPPPSIQYGPCER